MRERGSRGQYVMVAFVLLLGLTACSGGSTGQDAAPTVATATSVAADPAPTAPTATTTTASTATTTGTTIPAAAEVAAVVERYVLGDCDWPEAYPEGSDPIVATWGDIAAVSGDLVALRNDWGLPSWEMPSDPAELEAAGLYGFAHRIIDLPGTTLVSGAYLFKTPGLALAALDVVEATFGDAAEMSTVTGLGYELTEVTRLQDDPNAASVVYQIESTQEAWRPRTIRAAAFVVDDVLVFVRGAYPVLDVARFLAYSEAELAVVARMIGSPGGFPTEPLGAAAPEVGSAVAMAGDPWLDGTIAVGGQPQTWPGGFWDGPGGYSLSPAEMPEAGADPASSPIEAAAFRQVDVTGLGGLGPVFTGMLRYDDVAAAGAGFTDIVEVYDDPEQMALLTFPRRLDTITALEGPRLGDEAVAVTATLGDGTEADGLQVIGVVWRTGRDVQWIRAKTTNEEAADVVVAVADLATAMIDRLPVDLPSAAPTLNDGCGPIEGTGAAVLGAAPWLTEAAVLADGDPWVADVASGASDALVISKEEAAGFGEADWSQVIETQRAWRVTVGQNEFPIEPEFFGDEARPALAAAYRVHPGDGAGPVLWTGAILFEDTAWDDPATSDVVEQFLTAGMGWANIASSYDPDYAAGNGWLFQVAGDAEPPAFDESTLLTVPNLGEQITAVLITGTDSPDQAAAIVWRNGGLTQWVRARMPAGDDTTLEALIAVAEAMAARGG